MIQAFIDNEEVTFDKKFTIKEEMLNTSSVIINNVFPKKWDEDKDYVSKFYFPKDYSKFKLLKDEKLLFCGVVKNTGNISLNPRYPHYCDLQILDFKTFLSEGENFDFVLSNVTILQAIQRIVDEISEYGFVLGNVDINGVNDKIGAYSCQEKTAYDVFQYIADITQSKWTTRVIDENTIAIDFYDPETMPRANDIEYTSEYFNANNIDDMSFSYSTDDYRNKQIMTSNQVYGDISYTETIFANGYTRTFTTQNAIGYINDIKVNGTSVRFATKTDYDLGQDADFYYEPGKNEFYSDDNDTIYSVGTNITIEYIPLVYGRQVNQNSTEINRINASTGRSGIITRYENRNDTLSSAELNAIGKSYLKYKGVPDVTLTIETEDKDLFNISEVAYFDAPLEDLKQEYMVKSKEITVYASTNNVFYKYELTSSFNSENAVNYFDNQRNKTKGNISAGEFITRNEDIQANAFIIFNSLKVNKSTQTYDNVLNCGLNCVFLK